MTENLIENLKFREDEQFLNKKTNKEILNPIIENDVFCDEESNSKIKKPKIFCEMCKSNEFKYKCPRCFIKTCSLNCVKQHKKEKNCSGQKDKFTLEKNVNNFTEKELVRDIKFLNEAIRETNCASKKVFNMTDDEEKREKEKKNKYNRKCAKKFRNVTLHCSPMIMKRFSENKSYIDYKNKKFFWTTKFIFNLPDGKKHEHIFKENFDDSQYTLNDIIEYLFKNKQEAEISTLMFLNTIKEEDLKNSQILFKLNLKDMDKNHIKGKLVKLNKMHYEECDKSLLLKDILFGKDVLEYPEFYINMA
jgi:hypothetical protein